MAETEVTTTARPAILYEYIWFDGRPLAQVDGAGTISWTFTDHLGTPLLQTSSLQGIIWRAEHEPYGSIYALRSYDRHQPLRFPGQEAEQLVTGANGVTERSYNVHRWYRAGWGRYTQDEPILFLENSTHYLYVSDSPLDFTDPRGLAAEPPPGARRCSRMDNVDLSRACCDDQAFGPRLQAVQRLGAFYCANQGKPPADFKPKPGRKIVQVGGHDPFAWYVPQGNRCVDRCICAHEEVHVWQLANRVLSLLMVNTFECESYQAELRCLLQARRQSRPLDQPYFGALPLF